MNETQKPSSASPQLILGAGIVVLGALLFLANLGFVRSHFVWKLWPLILIALGGLRIFNRPEGRSPVGGYLLCGLGTLILLNNFDLGRFEDLIGPLIVVAVGILIVNHALRRQRGVPQHLQTSEDFLSGSAIFGGVEQRVTTQDFQGGELTSMFGGFEADLSKAQLKGSARIDVFVLFGGAELRVPEGWDVSVRATAALGGIENKTYRGGAPLPEGAEPRPRLVITGLVLFGGLEIKPA
ncbi:MAG TPA: LiaF domain-containing protein [Holophagaceae bacterium]|nr:LiaF domain-containing protein [Holophagaceae bacterium]